MAATRRAREAQARLARLREESRADVPKVVLGVAAALHVLLAGRHTRPLEVSVQDVVDLCGEPEREAHRGLAWLRDHMIIERPRTKGGTGHRAPTRWMLDSEAADVLRARLDGYDR